LKLSTGRQYSTEEIDDFITLLPMVEFITTNGQKMRVGFTMRFSSMEESEKITRAEVCFKNNKN